MRCYEYIIWKEGGSKSLGTHTCPNRMRQYEYITRKKGCSEYLEGGPSSRTGGLEICDLDTGPDLELDKNRKTALMMAADRGYEKIDFFLK